MRSTSGDSINSASFMADVPFAANAMLSSRAACCAKYSETVKAARSAGANCSAVDPTKTVRVPSYSDGCCPFTAWMLLHHGCCPLRTPDARQLLQAKALLHH